MADFDEQEKEKTPDEKISRSIDKWKKALENQSNKFKPVQKPSMREMLYNNPDDAKKFSEINVPEIDTKVVDLPKEDENEKELLVEHNNTATEPTTEPSDTTIAEPTPQEENAVSGEEVGDKAVNPETEEEPVDPAYKEALEEAQAMAQDDLEGYRVPKNWKEWTAKQKADSIKAFMENRKKAEKEKPKETKEPMSEEDILAEAEAIAQKPLPGFRPPANWGDLTFEEKGKIVKAYDDTKKVEDHRTNIDDSETNNFESYKRYPTGLRVAEDLVGAGGKVIEGAGDVAKTEIGGTGANMISERAKGVPHYDYTSLFGRR